MKTTPQKNIFLSDFLSISDLVLAFDRFMKGIDLNKYLKKIRNTLRAGTGIIQSMLKTVSFALVDNGYCSLRKLEDNRKVNMRYRHLMNWKTPSYRTFGYFVNEV